MTHLTSSVFMRRLASVAVFTVASGLAAHAQQPGVGATYAVSLVSAPTFDLSADTAPSGTESLAAKAGVTYSSSSDAAEPDATVDAARENLSVVSPDGLQPPPRRSYGRPRYNDNSHNPDGSSKYGFLAGAGFTLPLGDTYHYYNTSYAYQVGVIRNFNKKVGVALQFDWDNFGLNGQTLYNQSIIEDPQNVTGEIQGQLNGTSHVWSFSLDPTYQLMSGDKFGAYAVVGVGFYHKTTNFFVTVPETVFTFYGPITYGANATIDKYTANAPGFNGGFGLTYKVSKFANERLYAEVRYVYVATSQRTGITINNYAANFNPITQSYPVNDLFPANSNHSGYVPIKIGIRF